MEITNSNYLSYVASLYSSSASSTYTASSTTATSSAFTDMLTAVQSSSTSSLAQEMSALGAESLGEAPDFSSMSLEEFRDHLSELQAALSASGVDISGLTDPSDLSTEELEALQEEMASRGSMPPPPPPSMDMMGYNFVDYSSLSFDALESLFDYL